MAKRTSHCDLKTCMMCRLSMPHWLPAIEAARKNLRIKKGQTVFSEGDRVEGIYFIHEGTVKVHKHWGDKELIVRIAGRGAILGHRGFSTEQEVFPISATALEDCLLCFVAIDFFKDTLKVNPDFTYQLMLFYARELQQSEKKMRNLALMPVKIRLAWALIRLRDEFGIDGQGILGIALSRQDLAAFIGANYETVFRAMTELEQQQLLAFSGRTIRLVDPDALSDIAGEAHRP